MNTIQENMVIPEGSTAKPATSAAPAPHTLTFTWANPSAIGPAALTIPNTCFTDTLGDAEYVDNVRQAIRSWFSCWIPEEVRCNVHGPTEEQGTIYFQDIDEFLGNVATAAFKAQEAAKIAEQKRVEELTALLQRATEAGEKAADTNDKTIDLLTRAILMLESANVDTTDLVAESRRISPPSLTNPRQRSDN